MNTEVEGAFLPDGDFDEAFTYSRDRWTIATMEQEGSLEEMDVDPSPPAQVERLVAAPAMEIARPAEHLSAAPSPPPPSTPQGTAGLATDLTPRSPTPPPVERSIAAPAAAEPQVVERSSAAPTRSYEPSSPLATAPFSGAWLPPTAPRAMRTATAAFRRLTLEERLEQPSYPSTSTLTPASASASALRPSSMPARPPRLGLHQRLSDPPLPLSQRLSDPPYPPRKKVRRGKRAGRQTREQEELRAFLRRHDDYDDMEPGQIDEDDYIF
ncbi:hypothetical protein B0H15DRAFT_794875 [Mycena belliarum]|uniref:Uncharacterized protein n=1 Tax=Mycena belliarum TaxID=1033014 RepID=A0AAD6UPY7_9AGAR|nr:hypothetical protein B0H15DRAFT_794875 [Mycena belliae]